ncbi:MAG: hypothetical protein A2075_20080 [Geobacteraceae bacterium GWC2_58_44]|nr:MAG: hypothetical protein A2075_20080 [Geobacteraceae bacterium GWC2_58_44]
MLKKGLLTLVCLTVMSAVCAWAATTYSVRTQLTNSGGSIKVGNKTAQTTGIAYTNCTSAVTVVVTPNAGFKITALKQIDGAVVTDITPADGTVAETVNIAKPIPVDPKRPAVLKAQGLTATFASTNAVVVPKTWQLQLTNTNRGGTITTNGAKGLTLASVGLPKLVNYTDATPVTATVNATAGYKIKGITTTGAVAFSNNSTVAVVTGIPATGKSVNPVLVTYKLNAYAVATNAGIAPANPAVAHGGAVRLIVTPTGSNNKVISLTVTGGTVALTDRFGAAVTLPFQGPVKATISNITSNITVTAAYGVDTAAAMEKSCTNTCHLNASAATQAVAPQWAASAHKANSVDCVTCHTTMPGPVVKASVDKNSFKVTNAGAGTVGSNYCSSCHVDATAATHIASHTVSGTNCTACHESSHNPKVAKADNYVGSATCGVCHATKYDTFVKSGHNFKINKVVNNGIPVFPFSNISGALENMPATTTLNTLGKPTSYSQVSYVVGGYAWKARWIDKDGYIVSSSTQGVQYNLAYPATNQTLGQGWATYGAVQKKYTCGECHTTGWKYYSGTDLAQKQDGLSGMPGTWVEAGVQCEACHGPGKAHALTPATTNITKVASGRTQAELAVATGYGKPVHCGECHTRDGERNPYGGEGAATDGTFRSAYNVASGTTDTIGGRIRASALNNPIGGHHQTGDELTGIDPDNLAAGPMGKHLKAGVSCGTCHDPHRTTFYQNKLGNGAGVDVACTSCHEVTFTATGAAHSNADCITCHMPKLAKSAVNTGPNAAGKTLGDIKTHVFKIDLAATTNVALANGGKFLKPFITADYSCGACHGPNGALADTVSGAVAALNTTHGGKIHGKIVYKHAGAAIASGITPPTTGSTCGTCHGTKPANPSFVGAANCASCHSDTHAEWEKSFHTMKATYGPAFEGQTAGNSNIHPWVLANWDNLSPASGKYLLPHAILGTKSATVGGVGELYVTKERYSSSDVAVIVGQTRKQRYAVYDNGAARAEAWVAYTNNDGIDWNIKTVEGTPYKTDGTGGTPVVVAFPGDKARAGYKFLMIEVDLTAATPVPKASNYGEHRSWQERCISCHTTGFDKAAWDTAKAKFLANDPTQPDLKGIFVKDIRIACESCHGPGEGHTMVSPAKMTDKEARKMVCNQCHTRPQKNLIDTAAGDNRGFVLGQTAYTAVMQYTRPSWGSGNRQVSIDGKGRRDHQMDMDIRLTEYINKEIQGKATSHHGEQACFDCHATHSIGSNVTLGTGSRGHLKVANDATGLIRLKDTREALCGSCHTGDGSGQLPGSITVQQALDRFNGATGWPTFGWTKAPQSGPVNAANFTNEGGRGGRNQHIFNTNTDGKVYGLAPSQYIWLLKQSGTPKVDMPSTVQANWESIWPWEREIYPGRTIVIGATPWAP